ncbi:MAG TPA: DUF1573 domain-containing protein [Candidatus Deferrimicrobium sp.]|nr:DUF1573 domain-containing protein [Candidatus Deferrimicrobium sp.]
MIETQLQGTKIMRMVKMAAFGWWLFCLGFETGRAGPAIEIPNPEFDFGLTCQRAQIAHTFWIKSIGDDTLRITRIEPGCGCTKAPLQDSTLGPGDSTALELYFSTGSYRGPVAKRPYLETNIDEEKVMVRIKAELVPEPDTLMPITVSPFNLDVSQFTQKPRRKATFLIQNKSDQDYDLMLVDWSRRHFAVELPPRVRGGETVTGTVVVNEEVIPLEFSQSLTFAISDSAQTRYTVPVTRMVRIKDAGK